MVDDAAHLAGELNSKGQETVNQELAWAVTNTCNQIESAIVNLMKAAKRIACCSRDLGVCQASENLSAFCISMQRKNESSVNMALLTLAGVVEKAEAYAKYRQMSLTKN